MQPLDFPNPCDVQVRTTYPCRARKSAVAVTSVAALDSPKPWVMRMAGAGRLGSTPRGTYSRVSMTAACLPPGPSWTVTKASFVEYGAVAAEPGTAARPPPIRAEASAATAVRRKSRLELGTL